MQFFGPTLSDSAGSVRDDNIKHSLLGRAKWTWKNNKKIIFGKAPHLPHVSTFQAATVKLMSVTYRGRACRALTFRRVEVPSLQPKGAADGASKKLCCLIARTRGCAYSCHEFPDTDDWVHGSLFGVYGYYRSTKTQILS